MDAIALDTKEPESASCARRRPDLSGAFDRVVVINLARRPERMQRFRQALVDWPFKTPERFEAIDGQTVDQPADWDKGRGAWGCMLSHRAVMLAAVQDRVRTMLVLEDDAWPVPDFARHAAEFLANVPQDWDCLMFGGEHLAPPISTSPGTPGTPGSPGIVRCTGANRMHGFAIRRRMMGMLLQCWHHVPNQHCDVILALLMRQFKAYAPDPFLIGQDSGYSDITQTQEGLRFVAATPMTAAAAS